MGITRRVSWIFLLIGLVKWGKVGIRNYGPGGDSLRERHMSDVGRFDVE